MTALLTELKIRARRKSTPGGSTWRCAARTPNKIRPATA